MEIKQRSRIRWRIVILTAAMALALGNASTSRLRAAPEPPGASAALERRWNDVGRKLIDIAEDLPEAKYGYRPHSDARAFVDQLLHAAGAMASFADRVAGRAERYPCDPTSATVPTRGEVIDLVRRSVVEGDELLRAAGEGGLDRRGRRWIGSRSAACGLRRRDHRALGRALRTAGRLLPDQRPGAAGIAVGGGFHASNAS